MDYIVKWECILHRRFPDTSKFETPTAKLTMRLTRKALIIDEMEFKGAEYRFEMCERAATSWISNKPDDPDHAVKIVNDTINAYRTKVESVGDSLEIKMFNNR